MSSGGAGDDGMEPRAARPVAGRQPRQIELCPLFCLGMLYRRIGSKVVDCNLVDELVRRSRLQAGPTNGDKTCYSGRTHMDTRQLRENRSAFPAAELLKYRGRWVAFS